MTEINIEIDLQGGRFVLTGATDSLVSKRRARHYLKAIGAEFVADGSLHLPFGDRGSADTLARIRGVLKDFEIYEKLSPTVEQELSTSIKEEENFEVFSRKAQNIRDKKLSKTDKDEFSEFSTRLASLMPNRRLYPLQLLAAYHLAFSQNACNFSVPGAGKTTIVYGAYTYLNSLAVNDQKYVGNIIVVGPLSSFGPWEDEYKECFGKLPNSKRLTAKIPRVERIEHFYSSRPAEITLMSYQALPRLLKHLKLFLEKHPSMVVLDEAHKIKNIEGGVLSSAALELAPYSSSRVILTGTPAPNGYEDLLNLFKFIWPSKRIIKYHPYQLKDMSKNLNDSRVPTLTNEIKPYFIRIRKGHLNLPEPINVKPILAKMGKIQTEIYNFIENSYMEYFLSQEGSGFQGVLAQARLIRLMQASTNPNLLKRPLDEFVEEEGIQNTVFFEDADILSKIADYTKLEVPSKFIQAEALIKELISQGEKCIVWTVFIQNIKDLSKHLNSVGIETKELWGETPVEQEETSKDLETREKIIKEFHDPNSRFKVLIANPFAIAESISLHKACHNAIYLERSFNAGNFMQSKDRIHRYGLKPGDRIRYFYILSNNNIDTTIHQRLLAKEKRMLQIMEAEDIPLFSILNEENADDEDMRTLIKNYATRR